MSNIDNLRDLGFDESSIEKIENIVGNKREKRIDVIGRSPKTLLEKVEEGSKFSCNICHNALSYDFTGDKVKIYCYNCNKVYDPIKTKTIQVDSPLTTQKGDIHLRENRKIPRQVKSIGKTAVDMIHGSLPKETIKENYDFNNEQAVEAFKKTNSQQFIDNLERSGKKITNMKFKV